MMKKALLIFLALLMAVTAFAACGNKKDKSSTAVSSSEPVSSIESTDPVSSDDTSSEDVSIDDTSSTPSVTSSVATSSQASTATSSKASTATSSKASTATSSKASTATSSKATPAGESVIGSNPKYKLPKNLVMYQEMFMGDATEGLEQKKLWEDTLSKRYGVAIDQVTLQKGQVGDIYRARLASKDLLGVVYNYGWSLMWEWLDGDAVYALDEYLADNGTWKILPAAARTAFRIKNQIWAVPNGWTAGIGSGNSAMYMWTQGIRLDWAKTLGMGDIGFSMDVGKFKDLITAFNDNKQKVAGTTSNVYPIIFGGDLYNMWNIIAAYGVFVMDPNSSTGYSYNPNTKCFEDALLRDGMRQALELIRYFYQNKMTPSSTFDAGFADLRALGRTAKVGSMCFYKARYHEGGGTVQALQLAKYGTSDWNKINGGQYVSAWKELWESTWIDTMLIGSQNKNLYGATTPSAGGYCLMKGTDQPGETINFFVDLMYSSETAWFEARYNLLGVAYEKQADGTYMRKYFDENSTTDKYYRQGNLVDFINPDLYPYNKYYLWDQGTDSTLGRQTTEIQNAYFASYNNYAIQNGMVVTNIPILYIAMQNYSATFTKYRGDLQTTQATFIYDSIIKSTTIDKTFATYKKAMAALGGDKVIAEANKAFKLTNDFQSYT